MGRTFEQIIQSVETDSFALSAISIGNGTVFVLKTATPTEQIFVTDIGITSDAFINLVLIQGTALDGTVTKFQYGISSGLKPYLFGFNTPIKFPVGAACLIKAEGNEQELRLFLGGYTKKV